MVEVVRFHKRIPFPCASSSVVMAIERTQVAVSARDMVNSPGILVEDASSLWTAKVKRGSFFCKVQAHEVGLDCGDLRFAPRCAGRRNAYLAKNSRRARRQQE